jgi:acetolactate synthase-1/2/3 large subunit
MNTHFPEGISIFDDNIIFAQNLLQVSTKNNFYPNAGISSLGHAIPAAIGAQFADRTTMFAIIGDGGFQMCCMEIMTAVNYEIPLNIILFNNSSMGLIRKNQIQSYHDRFIDCDFVNPNYKKLAESFLINHVLIESKNNIETLFDTVDMSKGINLIEIIIDKNAFPNYSSRR